MTARSWIAILPLLAGCASAPPPAPAPKAAVDPVSEAWYGETAAELAKKAKAAEQLLDAGKPDDAAAIIMQAQPLESRLLAAPRPTLPALEAASDLDCLYARMLLRNQHVGWARMLYQKDQVRWKNWSPRTGDTERRLKRAQAGLAECDRLLR